MFNIGMWDWVIILFIVLLLFGTKKLPEFAKGVGKSISAFKQGLRDIESEISNDENKKI